MMRRSTKKPKPANQLPLGSDSVRDACDVCGREVQAEAAIVQSIIPEELAQQAGISHPKTARLCLNCCDELQAWYSNRVSNTTYDWKIKRFKPKSPDEMVKEYKAAYRAFVKYKRWRQNIAGY